MEDGRQEGDGGGDSKGGRALSRRMRRSIFHTRPFKQLARGQMFACVAVPTSSHTSSGAVQYMLFHHLHNSIGQESFKEKNTVLNVTCTNQRAGAVDET